MSVERLDKLSVTRSMHALITDRLSSGQSKLMVKNIYIQFRVLPWVVEEQSDRRVRPGSGVRHRPDPRTSILSKLGKRAATPLHPESRDGGSPRRSSSRTLLGATIRPGRVRRHTSFCPIQRQLPAQRVVAVDSAIIIITIIIIIIIDFIFTIAVAVFV